MAHDYGFPVNPFAQVLGAGERFYENYQRAKQEKRRERLEQQQQQLSAVQLAQALKGVPGAEGLLSALATPQQAKFLARPVGLGEVAPGAKPPIGINPAEQQALAKAMFGGRQETRYLPGGLQVSSPTGAGGPSLTAPLGRALLEPTATEKRAEELGGLQLRETRARVTGAEAELPGALLEAEDKSKARAFFTGRKPVRGQMIPRLQLPPDALSATPFLRQQAATLPDPAALEEALNQIRQTPDYQQAADLRIPEEEFIRRLYPDVFKEQRALQGAPGPIKDIISAEAVAGKKAAADLDKKLATYLSLRRQQGTAARNASVSVGQRRTDVENLEKQIEPLAAELINAGKLTAHEPFPSESIDLTEQQRLAREKFEESKTQFDKRMVLYEKRLKAEITQRRINSMAELLTAIGPILAAEGGGKVSEEYSSYTQNAILGLVEKLGALLGEESPLPPRMALPSGPSGGPPPQQAAPGQAPVKPPPNVPTEQVTPDRPLIPQPRRFPVGPGPKPPVESREFKAEDASRLHSLPEVDQAIQYAQSVKNPRLESIFRSRKALLIRQEQGRKKPGQKVLGVGDTGTYTGKRVHIQEVQTRNGKQMARIEWLEGAFKGQKDWWVDLKKVIKPPTGVPKEKKGGFQFTLPPGLEE